MAEPSPGFGEAEIEAVAGLLDSEATPEECMDVVMVDGLMAALACSPVPISEAQCLEAVLGDAAAEPAAALRTLLQRQRAAVAAALQAGDYEPLLYEPDPDLPAGEVERIADEWCAGFLAGIDLADEDWVPLFQDEAMERYLEPIFALGVGAEGEGAVHSQAEIDARVAALPGAVAAIHHYWRVVANDASAAAPPSPPARKPGGNAPCPCGSGRKYKKCCGVE